MTGNTSIEWASKVWNYIVGCSLESPGCTFCYAMREAYRFGFNPKLPRYHGLTKKAANGAPVWTGEVRFVESALDAPIRWSTPQTVFVNSMSDLFHPSVPDAWIDKGMAVMSLCAHHRFLILTKRTERMHAYFADPETRGRIKAALSELSISALLDVLAAYGEFPWPMPWVWPGTSTEDQARFDLRAPFMQKIAALRWNTFLSIEPMLGPIDATALLDVAWLCSNCRGYFSGNHKPVCPACGQLGGWSGSHAFNHKGYQAGPALRQIIVGGESGPRARSFDIAWARSMVQQCRIAGVPCFVKQMGASPFDSERTVSGQREPLLLKDKKGGDWSEWPADLRVREVPA